VTPDEIRAALALAEATQVDECPSVECKVREYCKSPTACRSASSLADAVVRLAAEVERLRQWNDHAASENLAFNFKAAEQINEARAQRNAAIAERDGLLATIERMRPVVDGACSLLDLARKHPPKDYIGCAVDSRDIERHLDDEVDAYRAIADRSKP
jgi:hypothetical protein